MWAQNILLAVIGLSAGVIVANGLFSFVIELGVVSDLADRTHTGEHILLYEDSVALGGILANIFWVFHISIPGGNILAAVFGILGGIFVGCWAMESQSERLWVRFCFLQITGDSNNAEAFLKEYFAVQRQERIEKSVH